MSTRQETASRTRQPRRYALWGFVIGVAITVPATLLALVSNVGEAIHPYLVPSTVLLRPLADAAASWPGLLNVALAAVVNGLVYATVVGLAAFATTRRER